MAKRFRVSILKQVKETRIKHLRALIEVEANDRCGAIEIAEAVARHTDRKWTDDGWWPARQEEEVMFDTGLMSQADEIDHDR